MQRTIGHCAIIMAGGLLLTGCGGGKAADGAVASVNSDPCGFLTKAEMTEITSDVVTYTDGNDGTCTYHSDPKDGVQVTVFRTGGAERMATARTSAKLLGGIGASVANQGGAGGDVGKLLKGETAAALALGDEAMWGLNGTLSVRKGDAFIEVSPPILHDTVTHGGPTPVTADEKRTIATTMVTKLLPKIAS